jgi:hypothetical protein
MVEISNVKVYDLQESVCACRNAMRVEPSDYSAEDFEKSLERAKKLASLNSNSGHPNFLTGIRVSFDIVYPQYFTPQLQRYHFIDIVSSSSKDHRLSRIMEANCYNKYVSEEVKASVQKYLDAYNANPSYENHMILLSNCPLGLQLFMRCSTNYMSLRNLYHQRIHDKLKEDWGAVLDMIRSLPYAEDFITLSK